MGSQEVTKDGDILFPWKNKCWLMNRPVLTVKTEAFVLSFHLEVQVGVVEDRELDGLKACEIFSGAQAVM